MNDKSSKIKTDPINKLCDFERFKKVYDWIGGGVRCIQFNKIVEYKRRLDSQFFISCLGEFAEICVAFSGKERFWVSINPLKDNNRKKTNAKSLMNIVIDIDTAEGINNETRVVLNNILDHIEEKTGISASSIPVVLSGKKGFHIWLHLKPIEIGDKWKEIDDNLKRFMDSLSQFNTETTKIDPNAKGIERVIGIPYTIHTETNRLIKPLNEERFNYGREQHSEFNELLSDEVREEIKEFKMIKRNNNFPLNIMEILKGVKEGERNESAFKLACYLRDTQPHEDFAWNYFKEWNNKNNPPLPEHELSRTFKSAYSYSTFEKPDFLDSESLLKDPNLISIIQKEFTRVGVVGEE